MSDHDPLLLVARAMTDAPPNPALVDRVRARLDAAPESRRAPHLRWMVPTAAAAALVVTIAVAMRPATRVSDEEAQTPTPVSSSLGSVSTARPAPAGLTAAQTATEDRRDTNPAVRPTRTRTPMPTEAELAWLARSVQPLAAIPTMTIEPLVVESTQPQPLVLPPLTITPLTIPPVNGDPDGGRYHQGR